MSEKNNKTINRQKIFCLACMGLMAVASVVLVIMLFTSGLLNKGIVWAITGGLALLNGLHIWLQLGKGKVHVGKTVCGVIALLLTAAMLVAMVAVGKVSGAFRDISKERKEGIYVGVYVRADDPAKELKDVSGYLLGIAAQPDRDNTLRALKDMEDAVGMVEEKELDSSVELASALLSGDVDAMLLNEAFLDTLEETDGLTNLSDQVKLIHEFYYAQEPEQVVPANTNVLTDSYIIYLSGSDARSTDVSVRARSDTNILAVVNPTTHRILLVNTPRDYYVPLARNGQMDKLTHAGIYGVDASIHTLENLYDIKLNYYVRLNFTSFLKLIDLLGGIDVENDQEFTSLHGKFHFPVGKVHLNSEQALGFVRERYSLQGGDNDRGKNQEKVIAAIIKKLTSTKVLSNYNEIIGNLQDSVQTNMQLPTMMNLINTQLESGGSYEVTSQAITGQGRNDLPSYAMPGYNLYVMELDQASLTKAKETIQKVMEGKEK